VPCLVGFGLCNRLAGFAVGFVRAGFRLCGFDVLVLLFLEYLSLAFPGVLSI